MQILLQIHRRPIQTDRSGKLCRDIRPNAFTYCMHRARQVVRSSIVRLFLLHTQVRLSKCMTPGSRLDRVPWSGVLLSMHHSFVRLGSTRNHTDCNQSDRWKALPAEFLIFERMRIVLHMLSRDGSLPFSLAVQKLKATRPKCFTT